MLCIHRAEDDSNSGRWGVIGGATGRFNCWLKYKRVLDFGPSRVARSLCKVQSASKLFYCSVFKPNFAFEYLIHKSAPLARRVPFDRHLLVADGNSVGNARARKFGSFHLHGIGHAVEGSPHCCQEGMYF